MPSPRASPAMRPVSPLSPGYKTAQHFDSLQPPSPRAMHSRNGGKQRRAPATSLNLPALPRFHPANFPSSQHSSTQTTPDAQSPGQPPISPRAHQRMYNDAQKQLYFHQREMLTAALRTTNNPNPSSPRLAPMGSPGPVTPLELEGNEGYLVAGVRNSGKDKTDADEVVQKMIREEARRQREKTR